jgi:catechol 2,3-dioxygenase-like lactoylglutathione lyase family enzyme
MFSVKNPAPVSKEPWQVGYRRIALEVEDMDKLAEHLKTKGIEITVRQMPGGTAKFSELRDPDGLSIELMQRG